MHDDQHRARRAKTTLKTPENLESRYIRKMLRLDDLLGPEEPSATFHDAECIDLHINYDDRSAAITVLLFEGDPDAATEEARERTRIGRLLLTDLIVWVQDPPEAPPSEWRRPGSHPMGH